MHKNVLVLVPHPDDAEFYAGGTLAKWAAQGASITVVVATDGAKGSLSVPGDRLAAMRRAEARQASATLGAQEPIFLNYPDFELDRLPAGELREVFMRLIRMLRPDAIVAQDPFANDEIHPDHRVCAWAAADATGYATLPLIHPLHRQAGLQPHFVLDKYFYSESNAGANFFVDIEDSFEQKVAALGCHRSQVEFMVADIQQQLSLVGIDLAQKLAHIGSDPQDIMAWAMRQTAAATGRLAGCALAEAFRHERFHLYPFEIDEAAPA